jgi:hypothetical protein
MAQAYLRYAPEDDARPEPLAQAVVDRASKARLDEIKVWLKPRMPALTDEEVLFAISAAIKHGGADGFRGSVILKDMFKWPVDMELCQFVRDSCSALAFALRVETRAWVVRVGIRFPGRDNEKIEWIEDSGKQRAGTIISIDPDYGAAIVQPFDGMIRAGPPKRVFAEQVCANTTKGEYAVASYGPANESA